jgi:hypothetical protein
VINLKKYSWVKVLETQSSSVAFDIPEYSDGDVIDVYVNGFHQAAETDYTLSGNIITFISGSGIKTAGTEITVICSKVITETAADPITDDEILNRIKNGLGITGDYQDDTLKVYIDDVKFYMKDAGVSDSVLNSTAAVGCIVRGVADLWNYGSGTVKFSDYFIQRVVQLATGGGN